ncbi:MAG TPA: hypothetical protein VLY46_14950 [Usitatibacter sp.]|nr:hypothetical protein [Usitatibacter sp.]
MKDRLVYDRDEFERLVRRARMQRAVFLGEAIAEASTAIWKRIASWLAPRTPRRALATG